MEAAHTSETSASLLISTWYKDVRAKSEQIMNRSESLTSETQSLFVCHDNSAGKATYKMRHQDRVCVLAIGRLLPSESESLCLRSISIVSRVSSFIGRSVRLHRHWTATYVEAFSSGGRDLVTAITLSVICYRSAGLPSFRRFEFFFLTLSLAIRITQIL
jgi:hypothetical protein